MVKHSPPAACGRLSWTGRPAGALLPPIFSTLEHAYLFYLTHGSVQLVEEIQALACQLNVADRVEFRKNVGWEELCQLLASSAVGIHTMWCEHFGIGIVQMMVRCHFLLYLALFTMVMGFFFLGRWCGHHCAQLGWS